MVEQGEILSILGPSGCGKTTTLRLIAGFEKPDRGSIAIARKVVANESEWTPPEKRNVGMVFQDYALFPHLTVAQNIAFGLKDSGMDGEKRVREVLDMVGLTGLGERYPHELSGGQQQRVALARALAPSPVVILLDEPFSNLDADMRSVVRKEVKRILRNTDSTAIFVTHDQEEAFEIADRVAVLNAGRIEQLDTPERIYHMPTTRFVADFVGQADFIEGTVEENGIETELGFIRCKVPLQPKSRVQVMIRPDDISFVESPDGRGRIVDRKFRGSENMYSILLKTGLRIHSTQQSTEIFPIGAGVELKVNLAHIVVFKGERVVYNSIDLKYRLPIRQFKITPFNTS